MWPFGHMPRRYLRGQGTKLGSASKQSRSPPPLQFHRRRKFWEMTENLRPDATSLQTRNEQREAEESRSPKFYSFMYLLNPREISSSSRGLLSPSKWKFIKWDKKACIVEKGFGRPKLERAGP